MQTIAIRFDLLRTLLAFVETVPEDQLNMNLILAKSSLGAGRGTIDCGTIDCGTIGCAIGWASTMPEFRALGFEWKAKGGLFLRGKRTTFDDAAAAIFGLPFDGSASWLFSPIRNYEYYVGVSVASHKDVFRQRCKVFFGKHGQVL